MTRKGRLSDAEVALERALKIEPDNRQVRRDLAAILIDNHDVIRAKDHCQILIDSVNDDPKFLTELGVLLFCMKDVQGAREAFDKAHNLDSSHCLATIGKAACEYGLGNEAQADLLFEQGLQGLPENRTVSVALISIFGASIPRRYVRALLEVTIDLAWDDTDALLSVAYYAYAHRFGGPALKGFRRLSELSPERQGILSSLLDIQLTMCEWADVKDLGEQLERDVQQTIEDQRPLLIDVWNLFAVGVDYPVLGRAAKYKSRQIYDSLDEDRIKAGFTFARRSKEKIRLGYLCPYTHRSSHIDNLYTVVSRHDRTRFDVNGYCIQGWKSDPFDKSFRALFDNFAVTSLGDLGESAKIIYDNQVDILIDTTGHFAVTCMGLAAMRPAPVVVHGAAGFNIIGAAPFYDYSLNDPVYLPDELASLYLEKPFYMPHCAMPAEQSPISDFPRTRDEALIPEDVFVFADFNHPCKYDLKIFSAWMQILHRVPNSMLLLCHWVEDVDMGLRKFAHRSGISQDRILFATTIDRAKHLRRLQLCDLALDTYYHCGGVTTIDCLTAGLPVVSALPDRALPLANASMLTAIGCQDLVMPDLEAYIEKAVELALAPDELARIRRRLAKARSEAPLFQADRWVRNLERGYTIMHERFVAGDEPARFSILDVEDWPVGSSWVG